MGLFRRRDPDPADTGRADADRDRELAELRATVDELRRELTRRAEADETARRHELDTLRAELAQRTTAHDTRVRDELDTLRDELGRRVDALDQRFATPLPDPPPAPPVDPTAALGQLEERIAALDTRLTAVSTELANQLGELGTDLDALTRIDQGQLEASIADVQRLAGSLGHRVDALTDELDEARAARILLANEHVRAQIALRRELARAMDELRRPAP